MNFLDMIGYFFYPPCCVFCGDLMNFEKSGNYICESCMENADFLIKYNRCIKCGTNISIPKTTMCSSCNNYYHLKIPTYYDKITAPLVYDDTVKYGIIQYKRAKRLNSYTTFSNLISAMIEYDFSEITFDFITAVPPRKERMRSIGFDQSAALAKRISKNLKTKYISNTFLRLQNGQKQSDLKRQERFENLRNAFGLKINGNKVMGKTILIVDDISTTGATFVECARVLKNAGASAVYCACLARTKEISKTKTAYLK